ncbi:MAG: restriction endonuclease subunit S [Bacteroidetes bacterium]|jgi:type I restriction enzyme S subunit|nr:restriction endonuclease subunit S [Bacteroidota bacterium]
MREDWLDIEIGEVANIYNGNSINAQVKEVKYKNLKEGFNYIGTKDVGFDAVVNYENGVKIPFDEGSFKIAPKGCVLVCSEGGSAGRKTAYIENDVCFGNKLYAITDEYNVLEGKYVFYYSRYRKFFEDFKNQMNGIIGGVSTNKFAEILFPLAPIPVQRAIISKTEELFSDLDNGIANFKKAQEQLKIYRQAVLEQGLTGVFTSNFRKNNPQLEASEVLFQKIQDEIDFSYRKACKEAKENGKNKPKDQRKNKKAINVTSYLPETPWNYYRLEDITYLVSDGTHFTPKYQKQGIKFLSVKNVRPFRIKDDDIKYISEDEHKKLIGRCKPENGDILYTKVGATYGYASKVKLDYEFSIFVSLCLIKPVYKYFLTEYLEYLMNSEIVFRQARQRVSGSGVPDLHLVEIRDFKIPLPSVEEQRIIIQEIESRLSVCDKVEQSINESIIKAETLRQSILKKAFEGKLLSQAEIEQCKQAADYEPASELLKKIKAEKLAKEQALRQAQGDKKKKATTKKKSKSTQNSK